MPKYKGLKKVYVLWSTFYKRIMLDSKDEMYTYQNIGKARKAVASLQATVYGGRNLGIIILECKLHVTGEMDYATFEKRRKPRPYRT